MSISQIKRFYKAVGVAPTEGGFAVTLDGRAIRTPMGQKLELRQRALSEAIAQEWEAQTDFVQPHSMPIMQLASTAIDRIRMQRADIVDQVMKFASTDLVCYRANEPRELVARQELAWQPVLDWVERRFQAPMVVTSGVIPVDQPVESLHQLRLAVESYDDLRLSALQSATAACGSLLVTLALVEGRITAEDAFMLSQIEESWQVELWGEDAEAQARRERLHGDILGAAKFLDLVQRG